MSILEGKEWALSNSRRSHGGQLRQGTKKLGFWVTSVLVGLGRDGFKSFQPWWTYFNAECNDIGVVEIQNTWLLVVVVVVEKLRVYQQQECL